MKIRKSTIFAVIGGLFSVLAWIFEMLGASKAYEEDEERMRKIARDEARKKYG